MATSVWRAALFLFGSGMCSLIYQMVWFQELKLVFGTSTSASAAVVAIFMAGLGLGSAVLGKRADVHRQPLALYGKLEVMIASCAAVSPLLLGLARSLYLQLGGTPGLGLLIGTLVRGGLAVLVLGVPTFLMGGTFPAMSRAVTDEADVGRSGLGVMYGANTLGAVLGVVLGTFFLVEWFGLRQTLFLASLINLSIGVTAWWWGNRLSETCTDSEEVGGEPQGPAGLGSSWASQPEAVPLSGVCVAAAVTGASFFLMETVWYRMLAPLLGGSTYSFGLILAMALLGIGLGGLAHSFRASDHAGSIGTFSLTTGLVAAAIALPYALGDRLAILTGLLGSFEVFGFSGKLVSWSIIAGIVVFPASFWSGVQFPLLLSLVGHGRREVGRQVGFVYAFNTGGAILGSVAGGFGLLAWLGAPGCWLLATVMMTLLTITAGVWSWRREGSGIQALGPVVFAGLSVWLFFFQGPTPVWRHSSVGFGRVDLYNLTGNQVREWMHLQRRKTIWEADGRESSVGLTEANGLAFSLNGKCDGNSLQDAPTQIMLGMISAMLHPEPTSAFVVGLGTGCSAGWLGTIPGMKEVVVVELEPLVLEVASRCASINGAVLSNPVVRTLIGDAREVLLTDERRYDLIVSEPSNPFRAGVASLFTRDFYQAVASRLQPGGVFSQWVQGYEIDVPTMKTIYVTLNEVFPHIETWQTSEGDLLLTCSLTPVSHSRARLEDRLARDPWKACLWQGWRALGVEGFYSHYVANSDFAARVAGGLDLPRDICTDDRMVVEFGLLRTMGQKNLGLLQKLRTDAAANRCDRPLMADGSVDWAAAQDQRLIFLTLGDHECHTITDPVPGFLTRVAAHTSFCREDFKGFLRHWQQQERRPEHPAEFAILAEAFAQFGAEQALAMLSPARSALPGESAIIEGGYWFKLGSFTQAVDCLEEGFEVFRTHPFPVEPIVRRGLEHALNMGLKAPSLAPRIVEILSRPFHLSAMDELRLQVLVGLLPKLKPPLARDVCHLFEPHIPWQEDFLVARRLAYEETQDPLFPKADADLAAFRLSESGADLHRFLEKPAGKSQS